MSNEDAPKADIETGGKGQSSASLQYALAIFYLLIGSFMIILSWILPNMNIASSVAFTLLGILIFITAVVQVVHVSEIVETTCGTGGT